MATVPGPPTRAPSSARSKLTALIRAPAPKASTSPTASSFQRRARPRKPPRTSDEAARAPQARAAPIVARTVTPVQAGKRRGRDSNPRDESPRLPVFKTGAFNRSATPPDDSAENLASGRAAGEDLPRRAAADCAGALATGDPRGDSVRAGGQSRE